MRLIDADKLKSDMDCAIDFGCLDNRLMILGQIDSAPTVEKRNVGEWIYHGKSKSTCFKEYRECSCCHCYFKWEMPRNSYCPNCGAEMKELIEK